MAARDVIVASVRDFLRDIQQLNLEKAELEAVNPTKASYLQSQIWRKFTIIQSLMDSCPEAKEVLEKQILQKRKKFQAEAKDLKTMRVPKAVVGKIVQGWLDAEEGWRAGPFPYLQLPPEIRGVVLSFLTCPTDQLNFSQVLPADSQMMEWNKNALRFEKVLSILMSRKMLTYNDILAGDYMQIAASSWFETYLKNYFCSNDNTHYTQFGARPLVWTMGDEFTVNPIPACIEIDFNFVEDDEENGDGEDNETFTEKIFRILRAMGHNIWDCTITIRGMAKLQTMIRIKDCLVLMPNIKYLHLQFFGFSDLPNSDADDIRYFEEVELPDLPNLQGLKLDMRYLCDGIVAKMLRKYGSHLSQFITDRFPVIPPEDGVLFPRLAVVNVRPSWYRNASADLLVQMAQFGNLIGSSLRVVHFDMSYIGRAIANCFRNLLCCLNQFGGTLDELDLTFSTENVTGAVGDLSWLGNIEFPKVKKLTLRNYPDTWNFVLHFPVLETLTWYYPSGNWFYAFKPGNHFKFSWKEREMCTSDVWKMLPFLKSVEFCHVGVNKVIRTRSEALAYQAKQGGCGRRNSEKR